jgi:hypothetical protein
MRWIAHEAAMLRQRDVAGRDFGSRQVKIGAAHTSSDVTSGCGLRTSFNRIAFVRYVPE